MKKLAIFFVILNCFVFSINAQDEKQNFCSEVKKAEPLFTNGEILVIGEVSKPQVIKLSKLPLTISRSIAMVGGVSRTAFIKKIQVVKCSANFDAIENITFVDFQKVKIGEQKDLELKGGEIIFVPKTKNSVLTMDIMNPKLISKAN